MKALVLGAGYGTRLYPLTKDRPKPLLPVGGKPILERTIERLLAISDLDEIFIVSNHRFAENYEDWCREYRCPKPIRVFDDGTQSNDDRLGAIGDIQFVLDRSKAKDDLLVVAGDNLIAFDLRDFWKFAKSHGAAIGLKDLGRKDLVSQYSAVTLDATGKVVDFEEKPPLPKGTLISIGVYAFPKKQLRLIKDYLDAGHNRDAPGYYMQWLYQQVDLYGFVIQGPWYDIGDIDSYKQANDLFEREKR